MSSLQRIFQLIFLFIFCFVLLYPAFPLPIWLPIQSFFYLDPMVLLGTVLSLKLVISGLWLLLLLIFLTFFLGRFFCAYICPLGTTFDFTHLLFCSNKKKKSLNQTLDAKLRKIKYCVLIFLLITSLFELNLIHWGSPLSLAARFYILIIWPLSQFLLQSGAPFFQVITETVDLQVPFLDSLSVKYHTLFFLVFFFGLLLLLNGLIPRFWCRYLCPAGAIFGLISSKSVVKKNVTQDCCYCGLCQINCPMQAISSDPKNTFYQECILCQKCTHICPEKAIEFRLSRPKVHTPVFLPSRRSTLQAIGIGITIAFLGKRGLYEYWSKEEKGEITPPQLIRPPGSVAETNFLNQCIRCGECMQACPTNMLQPAWTELGFSGMFSPIAVARRGACEPSCHECGKVCPTGAIRSLSLKEKMWAKIGTAVIDRQKCIAWEADKSCLVCDEACPYGAISLKSVSDLKVDVPFVLENKCTGCGFCENACPVRARPAIIITPMAEIRLNKGSYIQYGKRVGLNISRTEYQTKDKEGADTEELPPGFEN